MTPKELQKLAEKFGLTETELYLMLETMAKIRSKTDKMYAQWTIDAP